MVARKCDKLITSQKKIMTKTITKGDLTSVHYDVTRIPFEENQSW